MMTVSRINEVFKSTNSLSTQSSSVEADLEVPANRVDPFDVGASFKPPAKSQSRKPSGVPPPSIQSLSSANNIDWQEVCKRYESIVAFYHQKYPQCDYGGSVGRSAQIGSISSDENGQFMLETLFKGYDEKLQDTETMRKESEELKEENKRIKEENSTLSLKLAQEQEKLKSADSTNANLSAKLDQKCLEIVELEKQSVAAKAQIMQEQDKSIILTERLHKTELKVETMERLHQSYRSRVSEYDQCCVELGVIRLLDKLNQPSQDEYQFQVDGMLLNAIKNITRDIEENKRKYNLAIEKYERLSQAHSNMMQVYQQDLGKSERAIKQVAEDLDTANRQADLLTRERDNAKAEVQSFNREISQLQEQIRSMSRKFQVDAQDSLMGHRKHLSGLENEWSNERHRLLTELSELKQAKIDLQLQVGYLLRQRESSEDEMGQLKRHFDLKRDQFKREVLGIN